MNDVIDAQEVREAVGSNVQRLRSAKGWSQGELADKLGCSRVHLNRIEQGHTSPSVELLYTLADVLGVPSDTFRQACEKIAVA